MHDLARSLMLLGTLLCSGAAGCFPERPRDERTTSSPTDQPAPVGPPQAAREAPAIQPAPLVEVVIPEPELPAFAGREAVRVDELLAAVREEIPNVAESEIVAADYRDFLARFELDDDPELYLDYVRVKIAFEATRDGGWWGLHWDITNEEPNSEKIWAAWRELEATASIPEVTAIAECDELSALFAFVARRLGLSRASEVGLFWPTGNHVVAVWTIHPKSERPVRVIVPTSQIFLSNHDSLGTDGFDPWRQKTIYDYRRRDAADGLELPGPLASAFVQAIRDHGRGSQIELQKARNLKRERQEWSLAEDF